MTPRAAPSGPSHGPAGPGRPPRWWPSLLALALLLAVLGALSQPAWRAFRRLQAGRLDAQSDALIAGEEWTLAFERARAALQLDPGNPKALRVAAVASAHLGTDAAGDYYERLLATPAPTVLDREDYLALLVESGDTNLARIHLEPLLRAPNPTPRTLVLGARYHAAMGDTDTALGLARDAARREPLNPTNSFALAALLARSRRTTDQTAAREILWPFARTNGTARQQALAALLMTASSPREDRENVRRLLEALPERSFEEQLLLLEARVNLDPSLIRGVKNEMLRTLLPKSDQQLRLQVDWLTRHGFIHEVLELLGTERSLRDPGLFLARHRALMTTGDGQKGYDLLFHPAAPFSPFELEVLRGQCALYRQDLRLAETHLANAAGLSGSSLRRLGTLAQLAQACDNLTPAVDAWHALLQYPRTAGAALRELTQLTARQGETAAARDYARQLAAREPDNAGARVALAHAHLLLGEKVDAAMAQVRALPKDNSHELLRRALLALGHLRRSEPREAALALQGTVLHAATAPAGILAIIAATDAANGQMIDAQQLLDRIPLKSLTPEERELVRPLFGIGDPPTAPASVSAP